MGLYQKNGSGKWYAARERHPVTGAWLPAHSLGTSDRREAERLLLLERARALTGADGAHLLAPAPPPPRRDLADAIAAYLDRKRGSVTEATWAGYRKQAIRLLEAPINLDLTAYAGNAGTEILEAWTRAEVARLGRTHGVIKRLESIVKPALKLAHEKGWLGAGRLPLFPLVRSDYKSAGARKIFLSRAQFSLLRAELPEVDTITFRTARAPLVCYPRLWADIAVSTGMHGGNLDQFIGADWSDGARWFRRNTKGAEFYIDEWFPADPLLRASLAAAAAVRAVGPRDLWVAAAPVGAGLARPSPLPESWMRDRLAWAARRAGLGFTPQPIDFRRTYATWRCEEGWRFEDVARVLGNSSGMVREVYAQVPAGHFEDLVRVRSAPASEVLLHLTRELAGTRKGPRNNAHKRGLGLEGGTRKPPQPAAAAGDQNSSDLGSKLAQKL